MVLILTSRRGATDLHDRIYAILGLLEPYKKALAIDYGASVEKLYEAATVEVFKSSGDLELLTRAPDGRTLDLPSWYVDFSSKNWFQVYRGDSIGKMFHSTNHNLSGDLVKYDGCVGTLTVSGFVISDIQHIQNFIFPPREANLSEIVRDFCGKIPSFTYAAHSILSSWP